MSLGRNLELCGRKVLVAAGVAIEPPEDLTTTNSLVAMLKWQNQEITLARYVVQFGAIRAATVSAKSRTLRYRFEVLLRSDPDRREGDAVTPEAKHATNIRAVHMALEDVAPGIVNQHPIVKLFNDARTALGLECTVFHVLPVGELEVQKKDRAFYEGWAYLITCAEGVST
jgi:hypothetical protein